MQTPSFPDLGLAPAVLRAIADVGYETPSPIQAQSIPVLMQGRNLLGTAQTGTGKTAAFALPLLSRLDLSAVNPQILVLTPTRELAIQVAEAFSTYAAQMKGFHILPVYGGQEFRGQLKALRRGVHVIVGTPGRILDHLRRGTLVLGELRALVLDEADEMLRMGFIDDVEAILATTPADCQRALFSATMPPPIRKVAEKYIPQAEEIRVSSPTSTVERIQQFSLRVFAERKMEVLTRILEVEDFDAAIIFVRTKAETTEVAEKLAARGHAVAPLNGDLNQRQREQTIEALKNGQRDIVIATDVAARGLDVPRITHVINYDMPYDAEAYIHRIGRTGRAGREGCAIALVTPRESNWLRTIERTTRSTMKPYELPSPDDLQQLRLQQFENQLLSLANEDNLADIHTLLDTIAERQNLDIAVLAAALGRWLETAQPGTLPLKPPAHVPQPSAEQRRPRPQSRDGSRPPRRRDGKAGYAGKGRKEGKDGKPFKGGRKEYGGKNRPN